MDIDQLLHVAGFGFRGVGAGADRKNPEAEHIRRAADDFHEKLLDHFRKASERSPVVRLRTERRIHKFLPTWREGGEALVGFARLWRERFTC